MDANELRSRLSQIITSEIPRFATATRASPLPVIDASAEVAARTAEDNVDYVVASSVAGLRKFSSELSNEVKALVKYTKSTQQEGTQKPLSTNSPYLLAVWDEVMGSTDVVAICRTYPLHNSATSQLPHKPRRRRVLANTVSAMVKVDVASMSGMRWVRINTITTDRLIRELYELGYAEASDESSEESTVGGESMPSTKECTVYQMGHDLYKAAQIHSFPQPAIYLRFTRLLSHLDISNPADLFQDETQLSALTRDDRLILVQLRRIADLGVHVLLGPCQVRKDADASQNDPVINAEAPEIFFPTQNVNLDLSLLVAICSDITHAPLPLDEADAQARFRMLSRRQQHALGLSARTCDTPDLSADAEAREDRANDVLPELGEHARSLAAQAMQEKHRALIEEIKERCYNVPSPLHPIVYDGRVMENKPRFWTTVEARDRFLKIVDKIGGPLEKARAYALFPCGESIEAARRTFWNKSRYPANFIPDLIPIHLHNDSAVESSTSNSSPTPSISSSLNQTGSPPEARPNDTFLARLRDTCLDLLSADNIAPYTSAPARPPSPSPISGIIPASMLKVGPSARSGITPHTLRSLLIGLGYMTSSGDVSSTPASESEVSTAGVVVSPADSEYMTTLTANKSSITNVLRRMGVLYPLPLPLPRVRGRQSPTRAHAAIWIVEPRSLAEGMRSDYRAQGISPPGMHA